MRIVAGAVAVTIGEMTTYSVKSRVLGIGLFVVIAVLVYLIIVSQEQKIMGLEAK